MNKAVEKDQSHRPAKLSAEEWDTRVNLAAAYRLIHHYGMTDLIYTHISARVPGKEEHFLINPMGWMFDEVTASSLVKIDLEGHNVDGTTTPINYAGFVIHSAVHSARPDVQCVLHTHTPAGMAISMLKCGLLPLSQHAQMFHGAVAYHGYEGIALDTDERRRLVADLGDRPIMILRNHGLLTAGPTVGHAFSYMYHLEKACQAQLLAMGTNQEIVTPPREVSEKTRQQVLSPKTSVGRQEWPALLRMLDRIDLSYRT
jgi:ribulose-5-phosphate 4-epimerase/fuculose-1-phosphate aldolase